MFDARADNLLQFLERVAADVGSTIDLLGKRSQGMRYDPRTDEFVTGEGNDRGWFDFNADDLFMYASGKMYAYHGLLQGLRSDFAGVIQRRDISAIWDLMEEHVAEAAALQPLIVSNGREDGAFMPDHLAVMSQKMLRARANMSEIRDILDPLREGAPDEAVSCAAVRGAAMILAATHRRRRAAPVSGSIPSRRSGRRSSPNPASTPPPPAGGCSGSLKPTTGRKAPAGMFTARCPTPTSTRPAR